MPELLLVGNSRWHWAERRAGVLHCWHQDEPSEAPELSALQLWAAVGAVPPQISLPPARELQLQQIPLRGMPPWLGLDRALAAWRAWTQQQGPVLVVDAGTCLSFTCVDGSGAFLGGRLSPGLALQLRSLGQGTAQLPLLAPHAGDQVAREALELWPQDTETAMLQGCLKAMAAAVMQAVADLPSPGGSADGWTVWLTGGDAPALSELLEPSTASLRQAPNLCLEALAALAFS